MQAEIIAAGTELTTGAKLDTNSQWLSIELASLGIPVTFHTTVADDLPAMLHVLRNAVHRSDIVLVTGGLGPTLDDLTRQAFADLVNTDLVLHEPSLEQIRGMFARRQREMPERNVVQAMFPRGSEPLFNPRGTAPGIWMLVSRKDEASPCRLIAMPGVPSEMKRMFHQEVVPRLPKGSHVIRRARVNCFGVGESDAERMLGELTARGRDPEVGITVHEATITLRIETSGATADECEEKIAATKSEIRRCMGHLAFGEEDEELEHVLVAMLLERGLTVACVETGTAGLVTYRLLDVPGGEACCLGGAIVAGPAARKSLLQIDDNELSDIDNRHAIEETLAATMAATCRTRFDSDFALSVTDWPHFGGDRPEAGEPPVAWIGLAGTLPDGSPFVKVRRHVLVGDPAIGKSRAAKSALDFLRLHLLGLA